MKDLILFLMRRAGSGVNITWSLIWEILLALFGRVDWRVVFERLITRLLVELLVWLKSLSTNRVYQETVDSVLLSLRESGLKMAEENLADRKSIVQRE